MMGEGDAKPYMTKDALRRAAARRKYARAERRAVSPTKTRGGPFTALATVVPGPGALPSPRSLPRHVHPARSQPQQQHHHHHQQHHYQQQQQQQRPGRVPRAHLKLKQHMQNNAQLDENDTNTGNVANVYAVNEADEAMSTVLTMDNAFAGLRSQFQAMELRQHEELVQRDQVIRAQKDELAVLRSRLQTAREELEHERAQHSSAVDSLNADLAAKVQQCLLKEEQYNSAVEQMQLTEEQLNKLQASMQALDCQTSKELAEASAHSHRLTVAHSETANRVTELERLLGNKAFELQNLKESTKHVAETQQQHSSLVARLRNQISELQNDVQRLKYQLERSQHVENDTRQECERLVAQLATKSNELEEMRTLRDQVAARELELLKERESVIKGKEESQHRVTTMQQQLDSAMQKVNNEYEQRIQTGAQLAESRANETTLQTKHIEQIVQLQVLSAREDALTKRAADLEQRVAALGTQATMARTEAAASEAQAHGLREQLDELRAKHARAVEELRELKEREALIGEMERIQSEQSQLQELLSRNLRAASRVDQIFSQAHKRQPSNTPGDPPTDSPDGTSAACSQQLQQQQQQQQQDSWNRPGERQSDGSSSGDEVGDGQVLSLQHHDIETEDGEEATKTWL